MLSLLRPALVSLGLFTVLLGVAYPYAIAGVGRSVLAPQAGGSLVERGGVVVGSSLIGQTFTRPEYLHPRPSAAGSDGYDASASSGSNLGPLNETLAERVKDSADALRAEVGAATIPADAVTTSGSGLDPHVSPAYAALQVRRIAQARNVSPEVVSAAIKANTEGPALGFIGQPRVNVLLTNLALDRAAPLQTASPAG